MCIEIINILISITGIGLGTFVAYHVYNLSQQQTFRDRFTKRESIQKKVEEQLYKIRNGISSKVEILNVTKYDTHYPHDNTQNKNGYTYLGAELKGYHFAGVEFFCEIISAYRLGDKIYSKKPTNDEEESENIFMVGVIPYDWIETIDLRGDDTSYRPQFYTYYKGIEKSPYKSYKYCIKHPDKTNSFLEISLKE